MAPKPTSKPVTSTQIYCWPAIWNFCYTNAIPAKCALTPAQHAALNRALAADGFPEIRDAKKLQTAAAAHLADGGVALMADREGVWREGFGGFEVPKGVGKENTKEWKPAAVRKWLLGTRKRGCGKAHDHSHGQAKTGVAVSATSASVSRAGTPICVTRKNKTSVDTSHRRVTRSMAGGFPSGIPTETEQAIESEAEYGNEQRPNDASSGGGDAEEEAEEQSFSSQLEEDEAAQCSVDEDKGGLEVDCATSSLGVYDHDHDHGDDWDSKFRDSGLGSTTMEDDEVEQFYPTATPSRIMKGRNRSASFLSVRIQSQTPAGRPPCMIPAGQPSLHSSASRPSSEHAARRAASYTSEHRPPSPTSARLYTVPGHLPYSSPDEQTYNSDGPRLRFQGPDLPISEAQGHALTSQSRWAYQDDHLSHISSQKDNDYLSRATTNLTATKLALADDIAALQAQKRDLLYQNQSLFAKNQSLVEKNETLVEKMAEIRQIFEQEQQDAKAYLRGMAGQVAGFYESLMGWYGEMVGWREELVVERREGRESDGEEEEVPRDRAR